ncbi:hypothetical protein B0T20DRAFT_58651 [Sordaria brevicollis]|uniref:Uncharacterized protein n=1 Tax=Sordaria brevicollis TaxID=83679 RepID=A0AAE0U6S9_SORBR|nr:hypothetical protein B0T20DRAFT_58651 [Sordaria brevicollis]
MPSKPNARTRPPRLVLFDTIPELTIITGSISEMINSPTKVRPQNSPNSPIAGTFGNFITASNSSDNNNTNNNNTNNNNTNDNNTNNNNTNNNNTNNNNTNNNNTNTAKFSPTLPSPASPTTSTTTPSTSSITQKTPEPSSPTTPPMLPPPAPYPWLWSCHSCRSVYRLACTRRCLECGHIFCCLMPAANEGGSRERETKSGGGKKRKRSGSGRRGGGPCTAEFDYLGWSAWGSYRRSVAGAAARRAASKAAAAVATGDESSGRRKSGSGSSSSSEKRRLSGVASISPFPSPPPSSSSSSQDSTTITTTDSEGQSAEEDKGVAARLQDFATWHLVPVGSTEPPSSSSSDSTSKQTLAWHHVPERETRSIARLKEKMYVERVHNCWSHCDYPSECRQTVIAACEEGRAKIDRKGRKLVWVDDREKDAIEASRRRERERERENLKRALAARKSRAGQERSQRSGRRGRVQGSGTGHGIAGKKQKWEWELEPVVEEEGTEDVEMVDDDAQIEKDGDSSSLSSLSSSAGGSSSSFSSSDSSGSEDDEGLSKSHWKDTMTATTTSGTPKGPDDGNTGNLTIAMLEPFSRVDGCSSRQECYITIDPAKLLKDNDMETIPLSPVSPLAGGCLASSMAEASTYQSFASFNDFGPMEIDEMAM